MSEPILNTAEGQYAPLYRFLHRLCILSAGAGGLVIFAAAFMVTYSVLSSIIGFGAVRGEFELVELACATCASLFLPLCQLTKGHVMVDVFTTWLPIRTTQSIDAIWTVLIAMAWVFLCWRLTHGLHEMHQYGDRTMLVRVPLWWVYVPAIFGTGLSAVVALCQGLATFFPRLIPMERL